MIFLKKTKSQTLSSILVLYITNYLSKNILMKAKSRFLENISGDYRRSVALGDASHCHENNHVTPKLTVLIL